MSLDDGNEMESIRVQNPNQLRKFPTINIEEEIRLRKNQPSSEDSESIESAEE